MKLLILCLLVCSCAGTDAKPDEFNVQFGHGESDGATGARTMDSETDWASVGWTWHLGDVAQREHEAAYMEALRAPVASPEPEKAPEAVHQPEQPTAPVERPVACAAPEPPVEHPKEQDDHWWKALLPYLPALAIGTIAVLNKLGKVDWVSHKEH